MVHGPGTSDLIDADGVHCDTEIGTLTYGQRRGRAFLELIEHLPTTKLPQHGVGNAQIVVTIDAATLATGIGEATLDTGGVISAGEARRLACNAGLLPVVLDGPSKILDLGMSQRLFDRYQRIALAVRDKGCVWPGCDTAPGVVRSAPHHPLAPRRTHRHLERVPPVRLAPPPPRHRRMGDRHGPRRHPELIPPTRIDPKRRPIRHERLKPRPG